MSRTKGSGWGGGVLLYQICPYCGKKKVIYDPLDSVQYFKCTACRAMFWNGSLIPKKYKVEGGE